MDNSLAFVYPPSIESSKRHRQANKIFRQINRDFQNQEKCLCCGRYVGQQSPVGSWCYDPVHELQFLGSGVPLFFIFVQNTIVSLVVLMAVVSVYALISNIASASCANPQKGCYTDIFNKLAATNKLVQGSDIAPYQSILILAVTILWIPMTQYFIYRARKTENKSDFNIQTPSDYAILLQFLPFNTSAEDIKQMIEKRNANLSDQDRQQTENLAIQNILVLFKLNQYFMVQKEEQNDFKQYVENGQVGNFVRRGMPKPCKTANAAIVVFKREKSKDFFVPKQRGLLTQIKNAICHCGNELSDLKINNQTITISRAPEPDDIIWENVGKPQTQIIINKIITTTLALFLMIGGGVIQYYLALSQKGLTGNLQTAISLLSSVVVNLVNYLITLLLIWATKKEGNLTNTKENNSLNTKICYFQFFHAGIFYAVANAAAVSFDVKQLTNNFAFKVTSLMIINAFSPTVIRFIIDYFELSKIFDRLFLKYEWEIYSQMDANNIYQLPDSEIPFKYGHVIKALWLTCFSCAFTPIVSAVSAIGLLLYYYAIKFLFRYSYKLPPIHSNEINRSSFRLSYLAPLSLNLGQFAMYYYTFRVGGGQFSFQYIVIIYLSLAISAVFVLIPWYNVNQRLFNFTLATNNNYSDNQNKFQISYERAVPYYQGQKNNQRDRNFIRHIQSLPDLQVPHSSKQKLKVVLQNLQSDRKSLQSK